MLRAISLILYASILAGRVDAAPPAPPQTIIVELSNFKFSPATLTLNRGAAYRLHLVNRASGGHDFIAKEFFAASDIVPQDRPKTAAGSVELGRGEAVDIDLTPTAAGSFKIRCGHFMHSSFGMTGTIVVN